MLILFLFEDYHADSCSVLCKAAFLETIVCMYVCLCVLEVWGKITDSSVNLILIWILALPFTF